MPSISAHNIVIGSFYLDAGGKSVIRNTATGDEAVLNFYRRGWTGSDAFKVDGKISNSKGEAIYRLNG